MRGFPPSAVVALALSGLGIRLVPIAADEEPLRDRVLNNLVEARNAPPRKRGQRPWRPSERAVEYIHTDKPMSKRRARRQRGRRKA
jgi:hypothetical protein